MKYLPQRWITVQTKKAWTLQKWMLLTNRPALETCHQTGPKITRMTPLITIQDSEAIAPTPNM